jgi:phage tail sheath protein FI
MSSTFTYPGVYIQELSSPVHTIAGVATSIAAFVGYTARGIDNRAEAVFSFSGFQRLFGDLVSNSNSEVSYAAQQFFQNGGTQAYVVRVPMHYEGTIAVPTPVPYASVSIAAGELVFTALSSGQWTNGQLLIDIDVDGLNLTADALAFNVTITNLLDGTTESFPSVTLNSNAQNFVTGIINDADNGSQLVNVVATLPALPAVPTALEVTGLLGTPLNITAAGGVNAQLGGTITSLSASKDSSLVLNLPNGPAIAPTIKIIGKGASISQTVSGLASQLQTALNSWLLVNVPKASVSCTAAPNGTGTQGISVSFLLPNQPDAVVSFASPAAALNDAATALGLVAPTSSNVAHYALGSSNATLPAGITSTPATAPAGLPQTEELKGDPLALTGIYALTKVDLFNLLSIPEAARAQAGDPNASDPNINAVEIYTAAIALCYQRRAMLLIDPPPNVNSVAGAVDWKSNTIGVVNPNGAAFFPRLRLYDPLNSQMRTFAPSGVVAGVYASTDASRGVWKAPAGIGATLNGVQNMTYQLSDAENGVLNPLGLNCFRTFPLYGSVLWGARTLVGADALTNPWKYVPVRRTALFIEESLYRGTKWVVFEPNDEPLWAAIRLNVGSFMDSLFKKGAFQGKTADQAYFVKCDSETTTPDDIDLGIVNILVGFAPLKPAEFVVIQIEQLTAQAGS